MSKPLSPATSTKRRAPAPKEGGRWVWVPDGKYATVRDAAKHREWLKKRRAEEARRRKPKEETTP